MENKEFQEELSNIENSNNEEKEILEDDNEDKNEPEIKGDKNPVRLQNDKFFKERVKQRNEQARETIEELESSNEIIEDNKKSYFNYWAIGGVAFLGTAWILSKKINNSQDTQIKKEVPQAPKMDTAKDFLS